jgi:hypothetical protein
MGLLETATRQARWLVRTRGARENGGKYLFLTAMANDGGTTADARSGIGRPLSRAATGTFSGILPLDPSGFGAARMIGAVCSLVFAAGYFASPEDAAASRDDGSSHIGRLAPFWCHFCNPRETAALLVERLRGAVWA